LLKLASLHRRYADQAAHLQRQRQWLSDLQRLLDPPQAVTGVKPTGSDIETKVDRYLVELNRRNDLDETDRTVAQHIITTFRNRWWGLFVCYDVPGLPATNNNLESFFGRLKTNQRRITGHKSVNRFVLRYGAYVAFIDRAESKTELLTRLRQVDRVAYRQERQQLQGVLAERQDYYRFCHKLDKVVQQLEAEWQAAVETVARSTRSRNST
jgi:hypothetical protein